MSLRRRLTLAVLIALFALPAMTGSELGSIDFPNSGAPEAQETFIRAVLLLHSFEYEDAREVFQEVQRIDPDFALAYWGEAMTHNHPLWRQQDYDAAVAALDKFAPTPEARILKTPTERERGYLAAVHALYGEGEKRDRDVDYSEAMGELSARYPDDLEARAFYSLSILGTAGGVRNVRTYMNAGAVAEEVFAANPNHPGAAHYAIHSYDDPDHAALGLRAARVYAKIAPAASHAQHMISHIYVALGQWEESVDSNVKSFDVSVDRRKRKELDVDALNYHSLHWLEYSYLQLGRFERAREKLDSMHAYAEESGSDRALWYHAVMRAAWVIETQGRPGPASLDREDTQVTGAAADLFATGYAAVLAGKLEAAALAAEQIDGRRESASHGPLCEQGTGFLQTSKNDLIVADVMQKSLRALIDVERGKVESGLALFDEATALEASMPAEFGPPTIVKPSHELYGEVLLKLGRHDEARVQFEAALDRAPRRSLSLAGLARAAKSAGDTGTVADACAELTSIYAAADASVPRAEVCSTGTAIGRK